MELETTLALYRTRLSESRTAMAEIQLGFVLVTVPITLHTGFMVLAERHAGARPALLSTPGSALGLVVAAGGVLLLVVGVRDLLRSRAQIRALRRSLDAALAATHPGSREAG